MRYSVLLWTAALGTVLLGGCAHKPRTTPTSTSTTVPADQSQTSGEGVAGPGGPLLSNRTIYFDFDSSEIRPDYNAQISAHARYLVSNASIHVRLEGSTDERGSREYNIGLGERRAQAVRRALLLQGVAESQITTVSYGEERPAVTGHSEDAWAKNRRVEIVYLN